MNTNFGTLEKTHLFNKSEIVKQMDTNSIAENRKHLVYMSNKNKVYAKCFLENCSYKFRANSSSKDDGLFRITRYAPFLEG